MHSRICVTCDESYNVVKKSYDQRKVAQMEVRLHQATYSKAHKNVSMQVDDGNIENDC